EELSTKERTIKQRGGGSPGEVKVSIDQTLESRSPRDIINTALRALMHRESDANICDYASRSSRSEKRRVRLRDATLLSLCNVHNDRTIALVCVSAELIRSDRYLGLTNSPLAQVGVQDSWATTGQRALRRPIDLHTVMNSPGVHTCLCVVGEDGEKNTRKKGIRVQQVKGFALGLIRNDRYLGLTDSLWAQVGIKDSLGNDGPTGLSDGGRPSDCDEYPKVSTSLCVVWMQKAKEYECKDTGFTRVCVTFF
ncbi:hypothetical protein KUCAC02_032463, partial [Chaenocephalus aceratus]